MSDDRCECCDAPDSGPFNEFELPDEPVPEPADAESSRDEPLPPLGAPDEDLLLASFSDMFLVALR